MNDSVIIRAIMAIAFGALAIQGALIDADGGIVLIAAALSATAAFSAALEWGKRR